LLDRLDLKRLEKNPLTPPDKFYPNPTTTVTPSRSLEAAASRVKRTRQSRWLRRVIRLFIPLCLISIIYITVSLHSLHYFSRGSRQHEGEKGGEARGPISTELDPESSRDQSSKAGEPNPIVCPLLLIPMFASERALVDPHAPPHHDITVT
jgi:hypothetical protein